MKAKSKTTSPKRKAITPPPCNGNVWTAFPNPRNWSVFTYFPDPNCTFIEVLFDRYKSYSDLPTPVLKEYFPDNLLEAARAGKVKAIKIMNQHLPGSIFSDPTIVKQIEKLMVTGSTFSLQKIIASKKRGRHKYAFFLPHLRLFEDIYQDVVFLRELSDRLNVEGDDPTWGLKQIWQRLGLVGTIKKHRQWIHAIFVDKQFKDAKLRAAFIYGDITGWKSIHKYVSKHLYWKTIQPGLHQRAVEEAKITAAAWLKLK